MCTAAHHHRTPAHKCTTSPTSPWYVGHDLAAPCSCVVCGHELRAWYHGTSYAAALAAARLAGTAVLATPRTHPALATLPATWPPVPAYRPWLVPALTRHDAVAHLRAAGL